MWRTAVLATGLALTLAGIGTTDVSAQGRGNGKGKAKATQRFEERDDRAASNQRGTTQRSGTTARGVTQAGNEPWYRRGSPTDRRNGGVYDRNGGVYDRNGGVYYPNGGVYRGDDDDRYEGEQGRGQGPAFCRSGAGHPTKGRQWCYDKGYGLGNDRWSRASGWDGIILGRPDGRYSTSRMGGSILQDILGRVIYGRLLSQSNAYGWGPLSGRWLDASSGPRILQVQGGGHPLAEFYDQNRDGRVDLVMVNRAR